ncbi:alcohol dehydrogenase catalytic domain-containing protein, partial [Escherichia coli]|nr:alcohol dehydrogenase catalytic domain-containing protein [Escherichia coli]
MKALTYHGPHHVQVENVPDPGVEQADDIILRITATAICGSDLHLYRGKIPQVKHGDIFGHEFMGEVVETGNDSNLLIVFYVQIMPDDFVMQLHR